MYKYKSKDKSYIIGSYALDHCGGYTMKDNFLKPHSNFLFGFGEFSFITQYVINKIKLFMVLKYKISRLWSALEIWIMYEGKLLN